MFPKAIACRLKIEVVKDFKWNSGPLMTKVDRMRLGIPRNSLVL